MKLINIPTRLTLIRLIFSPLILPLLLAYLLPYNILWLNGVLGVLFVLLSITDFLDGYLARRFNQETMLGRILDPLADKFLTYSAFLGLLVAQKIFFYWVVIFIGREFFVMGIRHVALEHNFSIPVSFMGKLKTMVQMITITFIIINPYQDRGGYAMPWNGTELGLLIATLVLSLVTAQSYYDSFIIRLREKISVTNSSSFPEIDADA